MCQQIKKSILVHLRILFYITLIEFCFNRVIFMVKIMPLNKYSLLIWCFQIFMHKSAMHMHARDLQTKPHQCQQCLKSFSSNHQLVQHIRVHTGEKPYKCSYCDRRFKQLSHVQQHTRLHTGTYLAMH